MCQPTEGLEERWNTYLLLCIRLVLTSFFSLQTCLLYIYIYQKDHTKITFTTIIVGNHHLYLGMVKNMKISIKKKTQIFFARSMPVNVQIYFIIDIDMFYLVIVFIPSLAHTHSFAYALNFSSWQNDLVHSWALHCFSSQLPLHVHKPLRVRE